MPDPTLPPGTAIAAMAMARPHLPLQGLTLLAVEDSRFASDALRLLCQRSGARLRRADSISAALAHLRTYRPDAVIVDLGLPDGPGTSLIRRLATGPAPRPALLGLSGDPGGRGAALAAGAQGFLEKPLPGLAAFQAALLALLPDRPLHRPGADEATPAPDPLSLRDDLHHAARLLADGPDAAGQHYLSGFLRGIARASGDGALADAAEGLLQAGGHGLLAGFLDRRLSDGGAQAGI